MWYPVRMNELKRLTYLHAMGVDAYISSHQLPGAATTRRLAIVRKLRSPLSQITGGDGLDVVPDQSPGIAQAVAMPRLSTETATATSTPAHAAVHPTARDVAVRFSLATICCGGWLWLEELEQPPCAPAQLQLVQAMAGALGLLGPRGGSGRVQTSPEVAQFDWPMHTNRQLDLGRDAARSSTAGFVQRKLEQLDCRGLVLLGPGCESRVALDQLECAHLVLTVSTSAILRDPLLKRQAWKELQAFFQGE